MKYIYHLLKTLSVLSVFVLNGVCNKSYSQEKEVAWATPNLVNKLCHMHDTMRKQNNTTAVVFM